MPESKRFTIRIVNRPYALSKLLASLWEERVRVLSFVADVDGEEATIQLVVDNPQAARKIFRRHTTAGRRAER